MGVRDEGVWCFRGLRRIGFRGWSLRGMGAKCFRVPGFQGFRGLGIQNFSSEGIGNRLFLVFGS